MSSRGHRASTTPMDFEWSNQSGPVDPKSPFLAGQQLSKTGLPSVLDSPSRNGYTTPHRTDNRSFFFSQESASKPLPLPPHVQKTWEPRTPDGTYDASSGGETPNTPQVDSEANTPDTQMANRFGRLGAIDTTIAKKSNRRDSWFKRTFMSSPSPTKERERECDREKGTTLQKYQSKKSDNRVSKRKTDRTERPRVKTGPSQHDDSSDSDRVSSMAAKNPGVVKQTFFMSVGGLLSWVEAHPHLPTVLSYYLQLTVNACLGCLFLYIVYSAWSGVMADVDIQASKHAAEIMVEIAQCAQDYNRNRCRPEEVVPAMESICGAWETCMNRDPRKVARASVTAKTFAMIFNSFVEEFSYKSMIFSFLLIFGGFNLSNWAFGLLRSNISPQTSSHNSNEFIPQTPHRVPNNTYLDYSQQHSYQTGWQQQQGQHGMAGQTPYASMRIEAPPLMHSQSMPAVPTASDAESVRRTIPRKKGIFRGL